LDLERDYGLVGGNIFHIPMTMEYSFDASRRRRSAATGRR
jgi:phytoene dehydrogenase-like protein